MDAARLGGGGYALDCAVMTDDASSLECASTEISKAVFAIEPEGKFSAENAPVPDIDIQIVPGRRTPTRAQNAHRYR